ncbi:MAG TPA: hypothetical protein VIM89_18465 [Mucilaginibacter sp.]
MEKILLVINLTICVCFANAQSKHITNPDKIYTAVEKEPQFPGGQVGFYKSLQKIIVIPQNCLKDLSDLKVVIEFVVEKNGRLTHIKAVKGGCPETKERILNF